MAKVRFRIAMGVDPPFHHPVFVLTHHPRPPLTLEGGTTFPFVTDGVTAALDVDEMEIQRFEADTTFLLILLPNPGSPTESAVGPVGLEGSTVVLTDNADPDLPLLSGTLEGQQLVLETDDAEYDFNGDGTDEPAHVSAVFVC